MALPGRHLLKKVLFPALHLPKASGFQQSIFSQMRCLNIRNKYPGEFVKQAMSFSFYGLLYPLFLLKQ